MQISNARMRSCGSFVSVSLHTLLHTLCNPGCGAALITYNTRPLCRGAHIYRRVCRAKTVARSRYRYSRHVCFLVWVFLPIQASVVSGPTRLNRVFDKNPFTRKLSPRTGEYMASEDGLRTAPARCATPVTTAESEILALFKDKDLAAFEDCANRTLESTARCSTSIASVA